MLNFARVSLFVALAAGACAPTSATRTAPSSEVECAAAPVFADVRPLIARYCASCHGPAGSAGEEHDFSRFEILRAQRGRVLGAVTSQAMPPAGSPAPSAEERAAIARWARCGARL